MHSLTEKPHPRLTRMVVVVAVASMVSLWQQIYWIYNVYGLGLHSIPAPLVLTGLCTLLICATGASILWVNLRDMRSMSSLAFSDELTSLPNRRSFQAHLKRELSDGRKLAGSQTGILYFDLDRFKLINDSYGHEAGDQVIRAFGKRIAAVLRAGDFLARLSGDEFAAVVSNIDSTTDLDLVGRRVFAAMREPILFRGKKIYAGVSIGASVAIGPDATPEEALRHADFALLQAKESGRNKMVLFDPQMEKCIRARGMLENDVREAIANGDFEVLYQPLISQDDKRVWGVEALLRWNHRERGPVAPSIFIPIAEETGMIEQLGEFVLRKACREIRDLGRITLAVNISPLQFIERRFVGKVAEILEETGFEPRRLELEITESSFVKDPMTARHAIEGLRRLGVRIALDDFGAGYSSMSYLRDFPLDRIKIDRSFISDVEYSRKSLKLVSRLIDLGNSLGMSVTLEGVETHKQFALLSAKGCQLQGYLFSRPVSIGRLADYCNSGHGAWLEMDETAPALLEAS